jgi:N-acetylated-alpha-linked acidic dipeptidase
MGTALLRLADATVLPFNFIDYANTMDVYVDEIEHYYNELDTNETLDLTSLRLALSELESAGEAYERRLTTATYTSPSVIHTHNDLLSELNRLIYTSERTLAYAGGLPKRAWFRHLVYAPGLYTGYGVKTLPGIREGVEEGAWDEARSYVTRAAAAVTALAAQVDQAADLLVQITQ